MDKILLKSPWFWALMVAYCGSWVWIIKGFDIIDWFIGRTY